MTAILDIRDLNLYIGPNKSKYHILKDINCVFIKGNISAVVGASGSGKSMFLRSLLNLFDTFDHCQIEGHILFHKKESVADILQLSNQDLSDYRAKQVGIVFQQSASVLNPSQKIGQQLVDCLWAEGLSKKDKRDKAKGYLESVELSDSDRYFNAYPHQLSGGEIQRVLISMALITEPELVLADEPFSNLDEATRNEIVALLLEKQNKEKFTLIISSHDLAFCRRYADDIFQMDNGHLSAYESKKDMSFSWPKRNEALTKPFIELKSVTKKYKHGGVLSFKKKTVEVLHDFSMSILKGEVLGLVGPSGSGKSTIANILCGLDVNYKGQYFFDNQNIGRYSQSQMNAFRKKCQIVFQDPLKSLAPHLTIYNQLKDVINAMQLDEGDKELYEMTETFKLSKDLLNKLPRQLSGGQRQRFMVIKALLPHPEFLICDEILSSLDGQNKDVILKVLCERNVNKDLTILYISHNMAQVDDICDRIIQINS